MSVLAGARVVVTGGAGNVGSHIVDAAIDTGVRQGEAITPYYDPMIAKLIVHGDTRGEAIARLRAALGEYHVAGVHTNIAFLHRLTAVPSFADPMPYTSADCPVYGPLTGLECNSPGNGTYDAPKRIVGGPEEAEPLSLLEDALGVAEATVPAALDEAGAALNPALTFILGPLVRGSEVQIP